MEQAPTHIDIAPEKVIRRLTDKLAEAIHHQVVLEGAVEVLQGENDCLRQQNDTFRQELASIRADLDAARADADPQSGRGFVAERLRDRPPRRPLIPIETPGVGLTDAAQAQQNLERAVRDQARADIGVARG